MKKVFISVILSLILVIGCILPSFAAGTCSTPGSCSIIAMPMQMQNMGNCPLGSCNTNNIYQGFTDSSCEGGSCNNTTNLLQQLLQTYGNTGCTGGSCNNSSSCPLQQMIMGR